MLTTLTLTPAILGGIGPKVDWPKIRHENRASRFWTRWSAMIVRRRWIAAGLAMAFPLVLASMLFGAKIGLASSDSLAKSGPAYDTLQVLEKGGVSSGVLTPMEVLVEDGSATAVVDAVEPIDGVDRAVISSAPSSHANGQTVVVVIPDEETVNSQTIGPVHDVKDAVADIPGAVGVAGIGAAQIDFLNAVYGNFPFMLLLIAFVTYVLLVRAFRSLLLPLKAVLLNLLSLAATLGLMVLFWQEGYGSEAIFGIQATGAITFWIPLMVFAFLFGRWNWYLPAGIAKVLRVAPSYPHPERDERDDPRREAAMV